ncbi:MAG: hypothetical protein L0332_05145 [Chloroflexi bacterium]|nr:hypothetical protein [Chloroflexota bacterium]MCI0576561.1 hypothetical protein [Chloroflexota bacterium]MCI0643808.1 hypothetical protein [Chloroflexota bacterium]MCI0726094.1 hypothetical protein [Chloroflexota bacterium]
MILARIAAFLLGLVITTLTLRSAIRTFVLPRSAPDPLTRVVFLSIRRLFNLRLGRAETYLARDGILAFYAPVSLLALLPTWLALILIGYMAIFWASGIASWREALTISGSSLLTLGFAQGGTLFQTILAFSEATIGLILVALLIAYLPTMYSAFSRREVPVSMLEVRAGNPPSALEMLLRYQRIHGLDRLTETWRTWETWFAEIEESHTSLAALVFFRSPQPQHSWVTAAGAVLDAASLTLSTVAIPWEAQAALCIRAGFIALRRIADFFRVEYKADPHYPEDTISITREEYDWVCRQLAEAGVPLQPDLEQAWLDFAGWRVNYDTVLLALCRLTMAPKAPWSSDRTPLQPAEGSGDEYRQPSAG